MYLTLNLFRHNFYQLHTGHAQYTYSQYIIGLVLPQLAPVTWCVKDHPIMKRLLAEFPVVLCKTISMLQSHCKAIYGE